MLLKVRNVDLVAKEAHYHNKCRLDYTRDVDRHANICPKQDIKEMHDAHENALNYIVQHIDESIVQSGHVERMSMLYERYQNFMSQYYSKY